MFDVGFSELVLLFVIGLLILGPERLPKVASQIGRWVGRARRTANQLRHQLEREMALSEISKSTPWTPPKTPKSENADATMAPANAADESTPPPDSPGSEADSSERTAEASSPPSDQRSA